MITIYSKIILMQSNCFKIILKGVVSVKLPVKLLCVFLGPLSNFFFSSLAHAKDPLSCSYQVRSNFGAESQVTFKIINNTDQPMASWSIQISYPQDFSLAASWTVAASGQNPIVFSNPPGSTLQPGDSQSHYFDYQINHNGGDFVEPMIDRCGENASDGEGRANNGGATEIIGSNGGVVDLAGVANVWFPSGAFDVNTPVSVKTTSRLDIANVFNESAGLFRVSARSSYEVRISTGSSWPRSDTTRVELQVPADVLNAMQLGYGIEVFAGIEQGGGQSLPFTVFDMLASRYDSASSTLTFELPAFAFAQTDLTEGEFQALLIIALTPGEN